MYADFQEKIFADFSGKKFQTFTFHCCNVTTMKSLGVFFPEIFFKIVIHNAKVYTKDVPNIEVCDFIPAPPRTLSIKKVIVVHVVRLLFASVC